MKREVAGQVLAIARILGVRYSPEGFFELGGFGRGGRLLLLVLLSTSSHALNVATTSCSNDQDRSNLAMALANALVASDSGITVTGAEIAGDCAQFGTSLHSKEIQRSITHS